MAILQIREFPDELYDKLKQSAEKDRRSISQQTIVLLEQLLSGGVHTERRRKALKELEKMEVNISSSYDFSESIRNDRKR